VPLTSSQQRGVIVLLAILVTILALRLLLNPLTVPNPTTAPGPRADQLADRIDPNTATQAELAAIPELGEKRAAAIVEFRTRFAARHPDRQAFQRLSDLEQITGIGAATAENMQPYLIFPTSPK
jgi:DNA uptake protein ComE-like DNA-binding protein